MCDIAYKVKFLIVVNLVAARTIVVPCDIKADTLSPRDLSGWQYSNPLAVNRFVKRCPIPWTLNLGCANELGTRHGKRNSNES